MPRPAIVCIHAVAGTLALATILAFWTAAFASEFLLSPSGSVAVRTAVLYVLPILVLSPTAPGGNGFRLTGRSGATGRAYQAAPHDGGGR